jgi:hypothetical protein
MACESPYSVSIMIVRYFNIDFQKTYIDGQGNQGLFYDINPAGIKGLPTTDINTNYGPQPAFCPCDERIDENTTPIYTNQTLWSRTTCCSPCAQDANPAKTTGYIAGSVVRYDDGSLSGGLLQSNRYPPLSDNKRWQCATSSIAVDQMTWVREGPNGQYPFCYYGICWKDGEIDPYTDVETSGGILFSSSYYYLTFSNFSYIYQSFYEDICCATGNEAYPYYGGIPNEYYIWNQGQFLGYIPSYALQNFVLNVDYYNYYYGGYYYYSYIMILGVTAAKGGPYRIKMTSYLAVNPNFYTGPPLPGSEKGTMEETGVRKIDKGGYYNNYFYPFANGQPCNTLEAFSDYWIFSIDSSVVKGGLVNPEVWLGYIGNRKDINSNSFITTEELFFVSCIVVVRKNGTIQAHFGHHQVEGIQQSDIIYDYVLILPLVIPEFTYLGIVYEAKTIPFVLENYWYNTDEINMYMTLRNSGNCQGRNLFSKIMQAACTNNEKISPTFRRRMLEKQVLSRIKKVHYKP